MAPVIQHDDYSGTSNCKHLGHPTRDHRPDDVLKESEVFVITADHPPTTKLANLNDDLTAEICPPDRARPVAAGQQVHRKTRSDLVDRHLGDAGKLPGKRPREAERARRAAGRGTHRHCIDVSFGDRTVAAYLGLLYRPDGRAQCGKCGWSVCRRSPRSGQDRAVLGKGAEVPGPALAVVDLRLVVCRALYAVTCVLCWACAVCGGIEPLRLPSARQEGAGLPAGSRVRARFHVGYLLPPLALSPAGRSPSSFAE
jgi:hypothetical protein